MGKENSLWNKKMGKLFYANYLSHVCGHVSTILIKSKLGLDGEVTL